MYLKIHGERGGGGGGGGGGGSGRETITIYYKLEQNVVSLDFDALYF